MSDKCNKPRYLPNSDDFIKFGKNCTAGATAAIIAKTVIAPIERVKLILQLQTSQKTISVKNQYKGLIDCLFRLPKEQGFFSFWRGNYANVLRAASQESLGMAFNQFFKLWTIQGTNEKSNYTRFMAGNLLSGGLAGCATFCFIYPLDFLRTRLAVDMGKDAASREFRSFLDCFIKISKHDGFFGLYRGFAPSLTYIFLYRSAYYGLFDSFKVFFQHTYRTSNNEEKQIISFGSALLVGQIAAFIAALISYPLDTVRRRLMMQAGMADKKYLTTKECTKYIYKTEGLAAFFSGFYVNAIRGFGAALVLAIYTDISKWQ